MAPVIEQIPDRDIASFRAFGYTIGSMMVFPGNRIGRKQTINQARGFHPLTRDRFDITVDCIRRFYRKQNSLLTSVLDRYTDFFELFDDFEGYVHFLLLDDLIASGGRVMVFKPFDDFRPPAVPNDVNAYLEYRRLDPVDRGPEPADPTARCVSQLAALTISVGIAGFADLARTGSVSSGHGPHRASRLPRSPARAAMSSRARYECPSCGLHSVVPVEYGFPGQEMFEDSERGEVVLGGCILPMSDSPRRPVGCAACGWSGGLDEYDDAVDDQTAVLSDRIEDAVETVDSGLVMPDKDFLADVIADAVALEGPDGHMALRAVWQRAETLYFHGSRPDAISAIRAAMASETRNDHLDGDSMIELRGRLAFCLSDDGQHDESLVTWEALLPVADDRLGPEHVEALGWRMGYGECLAAAGRSEDALVVLRDVVERLRRDHGDDNRHTIRALKLIDEAERGRTPRWRLPHCRSDLRDVVQVQRRCAGLLPLSGLL